MRSLPARLRSFWRAVSHRSQLEGEVAEEFRFHMDRRAEDLVRGGMQPAEAMRRAQLEFGSIERYRHEARDSRGLRLIDDARSDLRFAFRSLGRNPGFTFAAVLTLALGVGGTAAAFGVARALLFEELPYAHADEVGVFWKKTDWTEEEFLHLRDRTPGFRQIALYRHRDMILQRTDAPSQLVAGVTSSAELFDVLGARPLHGRTFRVGEDMEGAEPVAVLSYGLWQELGGAESVIGTRLTLDRTARTVIGVMHPGFRFPDPSVRIWTQEPLSVDARSWNSTLVGRVAPGHDVRTMQAPVARITAMLDEQFDYPLQWDKTVGAGITPIRDDLVGDMRPAVLATLAAMGLVLLMACTNAGALMLGRIDARSSELAVRLALGANRRRLIRQLVVEALALAAAAGVVGSALAWILMPLLSRALPLGTWADTAAPEPVVFASAMLIAVLAAVLAAIVPMISVWRGSLAVALAGARTSGPTGRGGRIERMLVVTEVALAVVITVGAALLARSVGKLYALDPGVRTEGVTVVDVTMSGGGRTRQRQFLRDVTTALAALPGVRAAGATQTLPLRGGGYNLPLTIEGRPDVRDQSTEYRVVTPGYLETMGMQLRAGRTIDDTDRDETEPIVVINEALAAKYFSGVDPIGQRIGDGIDDRLTRVVGVVANSAERQLAGEAVPVRYVPLEQLPWVDSPQSIVFHESALADPAVLASEARHVVTSIDPRVVVRQVTTMSRVLDQAVGPSRQVTWLLSILTLLALTLGAVGIYGVVAHFVARGRRDRAIRMALGLPGQRAAWAVVSGATRLVALGIAAGALLAASLVRFLSSFLYGIAAHDGIAFLAAGAVLIVVGVAAAGLPALRAWKTDPAVVLRES